MKTLMVLMMMISTVSAASLTAEVNFVENGASLIVQPIWPENYSGDPPTPTPMAVISVQEMVEWLEGNWYYPIGFLAGLFYLTVVYPRHKRKSGILGKRVDRREEDELEAKDKMGKEGERTTVPGRKGIFRRNVK
jgi:hypothetical protein